MKCYYPIDSAGNRIGFKTPEACVYDASGTSLTTKLAQINSNISKKADTSHTHAIAQVSGLQDAINSKADLKYLSDNFYNTTSIDNKLHQINSSIVTVDNKLQDAINSKADLEYLNDNFYNTTSIDNKLHQINSSIVTVDNKLQVSQTSFNIKNTSDITYGSDSIVVLTRYGRMCMIRVSLVMTCAMHVRSKVVDLGMNVYGTHAYGQSGGTDNTAFIYVDDTIDPDGLYIYTYDHAFNNAHIRATLVSIIK